MYAHNYDAYLLNEELENPSCLQTTRASDHDELQESSQTVPHLPLIQTSTRRSQEEEPPTSLVSP